MENKLISITDFILEQKKQAFYGQKESSETLQKIETYAEFLKQPLTLGMFVPCDEDGDAIVLPRGYYSKISQGSDCKECKSYQKAKEKVLFKGFEVQDLGLGSWGIKKGSSIIMRCSKAIGSKWQCEKPYYQTVEDLVNLDIELTESAEKRI